MNSGSQSKSLPAGETPVVVSVTVSGLSATKNSFIHAITSPLLEADTFDKVIIGATNIANDLQKLGIFKSINLKLDSSARGHVNIIYDVVERPTRSIHTGVDFGSLESNAKLQMEIHNAFGQAEHVLVQTSLVTSLSPTTVSEYYSSQEKNQAGKQHLIKVTQPLVNSNNRLEYTGFIRDRTEFFSHPQSLLGISAKYSSRITSKTKWHLAYDSIYRESFAHTKSSLLVHENAGNTLKSSVNYGCEFSSLDDEILPHSGISINLGQEVAGVGFGDISFIKTIVKIKKVWTNSFNAGHVLPFGRKSVRIADLFMAGGSLTERGFRVGGIGPRQGVDPLGGSTYFSISSQIHFPIPYLEFQSVRGHVFTTIAHLTNLDFSHTLMTSPSVSVGAGLVAKWGGFRAELNACVPIIVRATDDLVYGLQFGIGCEFM